MKHNIKHIIKQILLEQEEEKQDVPQFSADDAFKFLWDKEGKRPPLRWLLLNAPEEIEEEDLHIHNTTLDISGTNVEKIPAIKFHHDGPYKTYLKASNCKNLKKIDSGLQVDILDVSGCGSLEYLPDKLSLTGLEIQKSGIKDFPKELEIFGYLKINVHDPIMKKIAENTFYFHDGVPKGDDSVLVMKNTIVHMIRMGGGSIHPYANVQFVVY